MNSRKVSLDNLELFKIKEKKMSASHDELISQFSNVTGADTDRAKFYLEASEWKLDAALAGFFDHVDEGDSVDPEPMDEPVVMDSSPAPASLANQATSQGRQTQASSRFATIGSLHQQSQDSSEDEGGQEFYAGGERSGELIVGPGKKKNSSKLVEQMFKSAKEHGAEEVQAGSAIASHGAGPSFVGSGFKLGDSETAPSEKVRGADAPPKQTAVVLKFWKNGFSVDDGPLRDMTDPNNKDFLDSVGRGEVPTELTNLAKGGEVSVNMEDHREEEFVAPKVVAKPFTGSGHTLGSVVPTVVSTKPVEQKHVDSANNTVALDDSKPKTQIQIRLADGSRMVAKFNNTHTVRDIRNYIITARPQFSGTNFILLTTFPNKELTEEDISLEDANLLNAVIMQRLK